MDNITHSLVGALIGQAGLKRRTGLAMPALIIGANLPDVDFVTYFLDGNQHLALRRGITHGPVAWVLLPLLLAGALYWFDRWQARRGTRPEGRLPVRFGWLYALGFIACLTHPALDWLNVYGVRLLEPFSSRWFYGDTLFIIDVWLWLGMGFATWLSLRREGRGREWQAVAHYALLALVFYIGINRGRSWLDETLASDGPVISSPVPLAFWERERISGEDGRYWIERRSVGNCSLDPVLQLPATSTDAEAFLFWSRAPFSERATDGSVILRDARYYDPRARDRFSVALPQARCEPLW